MSPRRLERVTIALTAAGRVELLRMLRAGELDLVLTRAGSWSGDDLAEEHLSDSEFVVCCSRRHRLARLRRVVCADLVNERWVLAGGPNALARLQGMYEKSGLPLPEVAVASLLPELRLRIVAATHLLGHINRSAAEEASKRLGLAVPRIEDCPNVWNKSAVVYRKNAYLSRAMRRFVDLLQRAAQE